MTCSECQVQVYEGEPGRDALDHLTGCEECRALEREVQLNAEALAAMRDEVMPVRQGTRRWPWVAAVAAAAGLAGMAYLYRPASIAPVRSVPARVADAKPASVAPALPVPARVTPVRRVRAVKPVPPAEPLLVKFLTDDPDVVIYWLVDPIQGEQAL